MYCTFGCSCISQAGVNKSRKTCAQLYDGHSAHKEGKLLEGCNSKGILPMAKWPNVPGSMAAWIIAKSAQIMTKSNCRYGKGHRFYILELLYCSQVMEEQSNN